MNTENPGPRANSTSALVVGFSELAAPFKGGVLVPNPDIVIAGLPTDGAGSWTALLTAADGAPTLRRSAAGTLLDDRQRQPRDTRLLALARDPLDQAGALEDSEVMGEEVGCQSVAASHVDRRHIGHG